MKHDAASLGNRSPTFRMNLPRSKRQVPFILGHSVITTKESHPQPHPEKERNPKTLS